MRARHTLGRMGAPAVLAAAVFLAVATGPSSVHAADPTFGTPTATSKFLTGVTFRQPVSGLARDTRVEIVVESKGSSAPLVAIVPAPAGSSQTLTYELALSAGGAVPGTPFTARWRLTGSSGTVVLGPPLTIAYHDDRFSWRTLEGKIVRMHWYSGSTDFGRQALAIADDGVTAAASLLGVDEREPIDFYVYADTAPFYDALGPGSRENVGGVAYPEVRTLLAQIDPSGIGQAWIRTVIPHELTHVVFAGAVDNPYHFPPKWLNEGLAVYQSEGYGSANRALIDETVRDRTIMPLDALTGQFPTSRDGFFLAYAESVSSVDYLVRTYTREKLVQLIRSYATGVSDDDAFTAALGVDVAGFQAGWLGDLGAATPAVFGPQPAPTGPLPSDWLGPAASQATTSSPSASPTSGPGTSPAPGDRGGTGGAAGALVVVLGIVVAALVGSWWWRRQVRSLRTVRPPIPQDDPPPPPTEAEE